MKKGRIRFYQLSIAYTILWLALCLSYVSIAVYFIVMLATDGDDGYMYRDRLFLPDWLMITLAVIVLVMFFRALVESYAYHIDFEDGIIKTDGERLTAKKFRLQFKLSIKIKDITAIGRTKWLYIHTYSKKQRIKMINIINGELGTNYDYVEMYKNLELIKGGSIFNREKDTKK